MRSFRKPSHERIQGFLERQRGERLTYREVGLSRSHVPAGFVNDQNRVRLGEGLDAFERARAAIGRWQMFPGRWACIEPANAAVKEGNVVAMLIHAFGLWWVNACRIVYVLEETEPVRRSGFAYGTLPDHVECGEELFSVEWHADDSVWYVLRAFSRPRHWLTRLGLPVARLLQRRFARQSLAAMRRAVVQVGQPVTAGVGC